MSKNRITHLKWRIPGFWKISPWPFLYFVWLPFALIGFSAIGGTGVPHILTFVEDASSSGTGEFCWYLGPTGLVRHHALAGTCDFISFKRM
jgi:hypothetical protein